ncbi:hypothetical protein [Pseudomonas sp. ES3-33]|uniref:hypothetical protein n=1 Tax=Pseudomonas sp. ES3-33 TaxID=1628833 RepID=UPI0005D352F2|nr:hypothetical protein [Pseudomonas sp. ES3-33]KJH75609.1 hypothetical protein UB23_17975 [Pseudomonas sp. ES3-33]
MDKSSGTSLAIGGISVTHCPRFDRAEVSMIVDARFDDCRILDVVLKDGHRTRIDSRTSPVSIDAVLFWLKEAK